MSTTKGSPEERHAFRSEAQQLLDLMIHSLYSNKEIFLRELISNASDALDRLRFEALTDKSLLEDDRPLEVRIEADPDTRTLTISDSGVGMSREELIENLGTIARSGTRAFADRLEALASAKAAEEKKAEGEEADRPDPPVEDLAVEDLPVEDLIGQFGVGFYSCFMVAETVTVISRRAGSAEAHRWMSMGDASFTIAPAERDHPGTTVTLKLRDPDPENGLPDFTQEWTLRSLIKKYSDFVTHPIRLRTVREAEQADESDAEPETIVEWTVVNSQKPLWVRPRSEVSDEEYAEFYRHVSHDWSEPLETITLKAEGTFEYHALLFVPSQPPIDLFYRDTKYGLQLYVSRVLIQDRCEDLLPAYLRFIKGVVDSPDLTLNVSREMLQQDRRVGAIRKRVVRKVIESLATMQSEHPEKYAKLWSAFGRVLKEGVAADHDNRTRLLPLLWFESTRESPEPDHTTLAAYVERMPEGQEAIYYVTGPSKASVERSPHLEAFREQGYEVLYFVDAVDELMLPHVAEFEGKPLRSVVQGDLALGSDTEKEAAEAARKAQQEAHAGLLEAIGKTLEAHVKAVRLSSRLKSSPVCLVGEEGDMSPHFERLLKAATGQEDGPVRKRILELNGEHPILARLQALFDEDPKSDQLADHARLLHGQALLAEGSPLPDPASFAALVGELMLR